jgi:hypothetical protein
VHWYTGSDPAYLKAFLPGYSALREEEENLSSLDQYCPVNLLKNPLVIDRIMQYLKNPAGKKSDQVVAGRHPFSVPCGPSSPPEAIPL